MDREVTRLHDTSWWIVCVVLNETLPRRNLGGFLNFCNADCFKAAVLHLKLISGMYVELYRCERFVRLEGEPLGLCQVANLALVWNSSGMIGKILQKTNGC